MKPAAPSAHVEDRAGDATGERLVGIRQEQVWRRRHVKRVSLPDDRVVGATRDRARELRELPQEDLLADDVVFYSPIVYTPQQGKAITSLYLQAAAATFPGDSSGPTSSGNGRGKFHYTKQVFSDDTAMLEFETEIEGKYVNGVDIIRCNEEGRIVEFRVMIRPLQAVNLVHQQMAAMLERMKPEG